MFSTLESFFAASTPYVEAFNVWVEQTKPAAIADHLCYRCESHEEFVSVRSLFESHSKFIYQSLIAGRSIAIIAFTQPIETNLGQIHFLELSDQKPDGSQTSGFDHIEIYPVKGSMDELAVQLSATTPFEKVERPHHTTYDAKIWGAFKVRLEPETLIEKIKQEEMLVS